MPLQTFFQVVELEPVIGPLEADHHGEREHHLSRVDLVDVDDVDGKRNRHRTLRICRIRRRILQVRVRNYHLGKIFKKEKKDVAVSFFKKKTNDEWCHKK